MTFDLFAAVSSLTVRFAHFLIESSKHVLIWRFFLSFFVRFLCLDYSLSDKSDESDKQESDELGSASGSACTYSTGLGGLLYGARFHLGVTISSDESYNGDGGSLAVP